MNCNELTTFLQKVLDKRGLIEVPQDDQFREIQDIIEEVELVWEKVQSFNLFLRIELSRKLGLSYVGDFYDGWAVAVKDGLNVYVDKEGEFLRGENGEVLEFAFGYADRFSEGIAVAIKDKKIVFIRQDGSFLPGEHYYNMDIPWYWRFNAGVARACPTESEFPKYIDKEGVFIDELNAKVDWADRYSRDGYAILKVDMGNEDPIWSLMDTKGNNLIAEDGSEYFVYIVNFSEGYAWVEVELSTGEKEWRIIDTDGKYQRNSLGIIARVFQGDRVHPRPFQYGWGRVEDNITKRSQFFSPQGDVLVDEYRNSLFEGAQDFFDGYAVVKVDGQYQLLGMDGRYLRNEGGDIISFLNIMAFQKGTDVGFEDGLIHIHMRKKDPKDECWEYMDQRGRIIKFGS